MNTSHAGFTVSLTACVALLAGQSASADTLEVPGDFATIQSAIDAAVDGDSVLVSPGVYAEQIDLLGKAIEVTSVGGAGETTIDGSAVPGHVVRLSGETSEASVSGFTITGGSDSGVLMTGSSAVLRDLVITGNGSQQTNFGGGIEILGGSPVLRDLKIRGNDTNSFGGGLYANNATLDASGLLIENNGTSFASGLNSITFLTFGGGGIYTTNTNGRIVSSVVRGNSAAAGGGVYVAGSGTLQVINSLVVDNRTGLGAFYSNSSSPEVINSTIAENDNFGIFTTFNAEPTFKNSIVTGNAQDVAFGGTQIGGNGLTRLTYSALSGPLNSTVDVGDGVVLGTVALDGDFRPLPGSLAIDAGDNTLVPADVTTDLLGGPRFVDDPDTPDTGAGDGPIVDLGAVEFTPEIECAADMNGDGVTDLADVHLFVIAFGMGMDEADLNGDGVHDLADVMMFASEMNGGCGV